MLCTVYTWYNYTVYCSTTYVCGFIQWRWEIGCSLCMSVTFPLQSIVIIIGVTVCEITTGIFIELEKNKASVSPNVMFW